MSLKLKICNAASLVAGLNPILSIDEDTAEAIYARDLYDTVLERILIMDRWKFAIKTTELIKESDSEDFEYSNKFYLPTDFLSLERFLNNDNIKQPVSYRQNGKFILCNEDRIAIEYYARIDEELLPSHLVTAFEYALGSQLATSVAENDRKGQALMQQSEYYISISKQNNNIGTQPKAIFKSKYLQAKNRY